VKRVVAEGDFVVLHVQSARTSADQRAIVEIFRLLPDGRIDEHWDVIQPVPGASANPNGMF
jgi:predicted SnoaL-like aldol condensation-catalyzing enzyme